PVHGSAQSRSLFPPNARQATGFAPCGMLWSPTAANRSITSLASTAPPITCRTAASTSRQRKRLPAPVSKELGGSGRPAEVVDIVARLKAVTDAERRELLKNGGSRIENQLAFARQYLERAVSSALRSHRRHMDGRIQRLVERELPAELDKEYQSRTGKAKVPHSSSPNRSWPPCLPPLQVQREEIWSVRMPNRGGPILPMSMAQKQT